jgi:cytochrome c oxidase subunit 1
MNKKEEIHVPGPSYWPFVLAIGLLLIADGIIFGVVRSGVGVVVVLVAIGGWALENRSEGAQHE